MSEDLRCFRCGASLATLTPPLSRQDECPSCENYLHVCRMCVYFDADVPKQCREDDAEEVYEKEKLNFCEWFQPSPTAFDPGRLGAENKAKSDLATLFGEETDTPADGDEAASAAEDLFR